MSKKTLLNDRKECIRDMIEGIIEVYPGLSAYPEQGITFLNKDRENKVAILSGGGSGHEPFPIGFIADNMLTGSVSGHIFTSPSTTNIYTAITVLDNLNKGGVLVAIMNYTGDQLNFGLAIERAKIKGIQVEKITISEDVALLGTDQAAITGNRGICGCVYIFKLLGALSEEGKNLTELIETYNEISKRVASMGACLEPCRLPNSNELIFHLEEDEVSLGCGVHGEAGISTVPMNQVEDIVAQVLNKIFESKVIKPGNHACVLIGNLGSLTQIESFVVAKVVKSQLEERNIRLVRMFVGTVMSSLDMKGFQVSVFNITSKEDWLHYLDSPTAAFGWMATSYSYMPEKPILKTLSQLQIENEELKGPELSERESNLFKAAVIAACDALNANKDKINELDSGCGDGDCGTTMGHFADCVLSQKDTLPWKWLSSCLLNLSRIAELEMGGTSGAIYSLLLAGAAEGISRSWERSWSSALETLYSYSKARVGHRTLVDAFAPACETYISCMASKKYGWKDCLKQAVNAAKTGCASTSTMKAVIGRAAYTESTRCQNMDAGAYAVTVWLEAIYLSLNIK